MTSQDPNPNALDSASSDTLRLVLGRSLQQPGETREQAAHRLAAEMLAALRQNPTCDAREQLQPPTDSQ